MNKRERGQIRRAIRMLHCNDSWDEGMELLCRVAGLEFVRPEVVPTTIPELVERTKGRKTKFNVPSM